MRWSLLARPRYAASGLALVAALSAVACSASKTPPNAAPTTLPRPTTTIPELTDGTYGIFIRSVDLEHLTVTAEIAQYFRGIAAKRLWQQAHPGDTAGPPRGYFVVRDNPVIRTLPIKADSVVSVLVNPKPDGTGTPSTIPLGQFPAALQSPDRHDVLFDILMKSGTVTDFFQVYASPG